MGYSNFRKIRTVVKKFDLDAQIIPLFENTPKVEPSDWLVESLRLSRLMPLMNEKTKAERVVSPILLEIVQNYHDKITLFSGEEISVNPSEDLSGECDFFFALHPPKPYIEAPIISLVEAKDEDMEWGLAQCSAQLYGAKLFNEQEGKTFPILYGCATDGVEWQFIRFQDNIFYVDNQVYTDLRELLGVWHHILQSFLK